MWKLGLGRTRFIDTQPLANTTDLHAIVGHLTCFAMLNRLACSCFDESYDETNKLGEARTVVVLFRRGSGCLTLLFISVVGGGLDPPLARTSRCI